MATKVNVYSIDGTEKEKIGLPDVFDTPYRPDIIQKSFSILHSNKRQAYGASPLAGRKHATASVGKGRGMSRVPRLTQGRRAALAPCVVGGRRAHPPTANRNWKEKINIKEKRLAKYSALASTKQKELVSKRGHLFDDARSLPIIVDDTFDSLQKTKEVLHTLEKLGVSEDLQRARNGKHIRPGKGKRRGRKYKTPKSVLIISEKDKQKNGATNLIGVDIVHPAHVNIEHLAPGGVSGRLTIITKSALQVLGGKN